MTREVTHYKMFEAALDSIQPNFPPAVLGADPRYLQQAYNFSEGTVRGPWNEGEIKGMGKKFLYVEDPLAYVQETEGLTKLPDDYSKELEAAEKLDEKMSQIKSAEVKDAEPKGVPQWSTYTDDKK